MRSIIDFFHAPFKALTVIYLVLSGVVLFFLVTLMYVFPSFLFIAPIPPPHIDLSKVTPVQWVGGLCGFSLLVLVLSRKSKY